MKARRVTATRDAGGGSSFVADDVLESIGPALFGGAEILELWGADAALALPDPAPAASWSGYFPRSGGVRVGIWILPPASRATERPADLESAAAEAEAAVPGITDVVATETGHHHAPETVDLAYVLEGTVTVQLEGGAEETVGAGGLIVQHGSNRTWINRDSDAEAQLLTIFLGAEEEDA
jgi:hypothetical protein